eukprot:TRINITY_DN6974_c0_g1_i1.p1 TRINITY_DN6974_c0_g1~~TRINITY_DN6974_c0_g1_i1.p1  ORF type:complete len:250 (-),score=54.09 TRINITY_DN6974_c0_g1_i1:99-848(-)
MTQQRDYRYLENQDTWFNGVDTVESTWTQTLQQALDWMPAELRTMVRSPPSSPQDPPLVMFWLGARNEVLSQFDTLPRVFGRSIHLYLIGDELARNFKKRVRSDSGHVVSVWTVDGRYPEVRQTHADILPPEVVPDVVVFFCPGFDRYFISWSVVLAEMIQMERPPLCVTTGYSVDQSYVSDQEIVEALGGRVIVPPRKSLRGWQHPMSPTAVLNCWLMVFQGRNESVEVPAIETVIDRLVLRGFEILP